MRGLLRPAALAAAFLLLGGCLLAAASGLLGAEGVEIRSVGPGRLYLPAAGESVTLTAHADGEGGHVHADAAVDGGRFNAAVLLRGRFDGAGAAAAELSRRGVAVLLADRDVSAAEAWDYMLSQRFTRLSAAALMAGTDRAREALSLADSLVGGGRECAAVMVLGDEDTVRAGAAARCRNLLVLTSRPASDEAYLAFFGSASAAARGFEGYFSEGTARAAEAVGGGPRFSDAGVLARIIDWQGSSLGHAVELPDDDVIYKDMTCYRWCAWACFAAAAAALLRRKTIGGPI